MIYISAIRFLWFSLVLSMFWPIGQNNTDTKSITPQGQTICASTEAHYESFNSEPCDRITTIVLDAGHGGHDSGCVGHGAQEKKIALQITRTVRDIILAQHPDVRIVMTRDRDVFIPLHERAKIANEAAADVFVSIHCNAAPGKSSVRGTESFVLGLHRAEDNLNVAKRENSSILLEDNYEQFYHGFDPDAPETHILLSLFQNVYLDQSIQLADRVEQAFGQKRKVPSRGVKQAGFAVLRLTTMPSVLIETGFLTHKGESKSLNSEKGQKTTAEAIAKAIIDYKKDREKNCGTVVSPTTENVTESSQTTESATVVTTSEKPVEQNTNSALPQYSIQLGVSSTSRSTSPDQWSGLQPVHEIQVNGLYKYRYGDFLSDAEARSELGRLKTEGYPDAFIVKI